MRSASGAAVTAYLVAGATTLVMVHGVAGATQGLGPALIALVAGLVLPLSFARWPFVRVLQCAFALLMACGLAAWASDLLPAYPYGDGAMLARYLEDGVRFPRWLLGMAVAIPIYDGAWQSTAARALLPPHLESARAFAALAGLLVMGCGTLAILARFPGRLSVAFGVLVPVWILFSAGYVEYYPLMIGAWLASLAWAFERPLRERPSWQVGAVAGLLPALYVGAAGMAIGLVGAAALDRPRKALAVAGWAALAFVLAVSLAYPDGLRAFLVDLESRMNFGDHNTLFARYVGQAAGPRSIFFTATYAFSTVHLGDVLYMTFFAGGWLFVPLGAAALVQLRRPALAAAARDARTWLALALGAWQAAYVLFMIPKLGPTGDIDLFASSFVLAGFLVGELFDRLGADEALRTAVLSAVTGVCVATSPYLVGVTMPVRT